MIPIEVKAIIYSDGYKVRPSYPISCPNCKTGFAMWRYGFRHRKVRD